MINELIFLKKILYLIPSIIEIDEIDELYDFVQKDRAPVFLPIEEKRYRVDDALLVVNHQFIVLDPDSYMLRFSQNITQIKITAQY